MGLNPLPGLGLAASPTTRPARWSTSSGSRPDATAAGGPWTVYVVEPHGNAVFADARLPDGFVPAAWGADFNPTTRPRTASSSSLFAGDGRVGRDRHRLARLRLALARASSPAP